jgi:adenylate cyclase class 2
MQKEFETQVLNIDEADIRAKLKKLGAKEEPKKSHRRWVYDINPHGCSEWVRLRTDGKKTTICYKLRKDNSPTGTEEIEVEVDDFEKTAELLSKLSFYFEKYYQENISQIYRLDDIEFKIDKWPMIPTMFEIEAKSEKGVARGLELLGLTGREYGHHGHVRIYKDYGIDLHDLKELKFDEKK